MALHNFYVERSVSFMTETDIFILLGSGHFMRFVLKHKASDKRWIKIVDKGYFLNQKKLTKKMWIILMELMVNLLKTDG